MSKTPYQVLGVSPTASDEEIKQAYRELARKYHPDRYTNNELADLAVEKMKAINAAYDEIQQIRASGNDPYAPRKHAQKTEGGTGSHGTGNSTDGANYSSGSYARGQYSSEARARYTLIRNCINAGNITEAERLLDETAEADRGAEWFFLTGCVQQRKGFYVDAQNSFDTAYRMEPTNNEYWTFKEKMHSRAQNFGGGYQTGRQSNGCCDCDMCTSLICADCCCECMGGDLIPCC